MKNFKKLFVLVASVMMALAMTVTAFAADTYKITAPSNGHTYEVYQIFTGDLSEGVLSNVKAGKNFKGNDVAAALTAIEAASGTDAEKLEVITPYVDLDSTPAYTVADGASVDVPAGYYLIKDIDNATVGKDDSSTLYIVQVVKNVTIDPKTDTPTVEKKVYDEEKGFQDSSVYDIGDEIPYKLTATLGDISAYSTYYVQFDDTLTAGLTYNKNAKVNIGGVDVTSQFTIGYDESTMTLYVTCNDVKTLKGVTVGEGTEIVVAYTATLNEKAVIGSTGNPNEVKLEYSNNPNVSKDGEKGETPKDKFTVFTFKVVANKVDGDNKALKGAAFDLYKKVDNEYVKVSEFTSDEAGTTFTITGLGKGDYKIVETQTPAGYNTIADQEFTVTAAYQSEAEDPQLTSLSGNATTGVITFTASTNDGSLTTNIVNYKGATLPTTGGMGTTIFYVIGSVLVVAAGVLLITRKRMAR